MTIRVLIVDDHAVVRQGLRMFLKADPELRVVGEAADGKEAVRMAREYQPDVVLMDVLMPVMDGIHATREIRAENPRIQVLALTSVLEDAHIIDAIRAGAAGYLLKDIEGPDLRKAIKATAAGQAQMSPQVAARLMQEVRNPPSASTLTVREVQVLKLLAGGRSNKQIAHQLKISEETVKNHVSNILSKLNLTSRTQAALYAVRSGIVTD